MRGIVRLLCVLGFSLSVSSSARAVEAQEHVHPVTVSVVEMIRWMPADTESIAVTQAPVRLSARHDWAGVGPETVLDRLADASALLPDYDWSKGAKLARVVSGSRRFSLPKNLGPFLFEGCSILEFASDSPLTTEQLLKEQVQGILESALSERELKIVKMRFGLEDGKNHTLEEVGQEFAVTRERIRQIEAKALAKLRKHKDAKKLYEYLS